jgi:phenylpyruvate tautomerase PptA (4-oxalocrotonate tautomerase family)
MAVEIENSIGVALPLASLMKARTIGQIATLIAEHMGAVPSKTIMITAEPAAEDVDLDSISDDDLD